MIADQTNELMVGAMENWLHKRCDDGHLLHYIIMYYQSTRLLNVAIIYFYSNKILKFI